MNVLYLHSHDTGRYVQHYENDIDLTETFSFYGLCKISF